MVLTDKGKSFGQLKSNLEANEQKLNQLDLEMLELDWKEKILLAHAQESPGYDFILGSGKLFHNPFVSYPINLVVK